MEKNIEGIVQSGDVLFLMLGAVMVFAMHAGFAFLEVGTVRKKNQVNALVKILSDWSVSTVLYFLIGYPLAYGISFLRPAESLMAGDQGYQLVRFFFLLCFAACIPAIISGGIAERAKFWTQLAAGAIFAGLIYPVFESLIWGRYSASFQGVIESLGSAPFHDFAGSVVVHSLGGWIALTAIFILGPRLGRYSKRGSRPIPVSNIPFMALGSWILAVGWFGFNVMSAQNLSGISGLVAVNSLMAMCGGVLAALFTTRRDPGFVHNGALAGLVAICSSSDIVHPLSALVIGAVGALIFVKGFIWETEKLRLDDVLGVWPLHGLVGSWGGIATGIFGYKALGGLGGVTFVSQFIGTATAAIYALFAGIVVYKLLDLGFGIRLNEDEEFRGADLSVHSIDAYPESRIEAA